MIPTADSWKESPFLTDLSNHRNCTGPVSNLVDFLPFLQKLPTLMSIRGKTLHNDLVKTYGGMITSISSRLAAGLPVPDCLAKTMLQYQLSEGLDDIDMAILASAFMIGGVETTASIMQWFAALIPAYPAIQARAQEELDRVVGRNRLPGIEDEKNLPYVRAIIKEVERTRNPFWLGTPHTATRDFVCKGEYLIPEGTVVVLNTWTMHHKEERYPEPEVFRPERYLGDKLSSFESANLAEADKRDHWMFGAGYVFLLPLPPTSEFSTRLLALLEGFDGADWFLIIDAVSAPACKLPSAKFSWPSHGCCGALTSENSPTSRLILMNMMVCRGVARCLSA